MNKKLFSISLILLLNGIQSLAQKTLTGKVSDAKINEPLIGASVLIKGSTIGTITDLNGAFSIECKCELPITMVIKYIGYQTKTVEISDFQSLMIYLSSDEKAFGEVTVTARRRTEELQNTPIPIAVIGGKELDNSASLFF
jgi:iron complex outermembrane recepter protein